MIIRESPEQNNLQLLSKNDAKLIVKILLWKCENFHMYCTYVREYGFTTLNTITDNDTDSEPTSRKFFKFNFFFFFFSLYNLALFIRFLFKYKIHKKLHLTLI